MGTFLGARVNIALAFILSLTEKVFSPEHYIKYFFFCGVNLKNHSTDFNCRFHSH